MGDDLLLIITFVLMILLIIFGQLFFWRDKKKSRENLDKDWTEFEKAVSLNDIERIKLVGERLVYNPYLKPDQLKQMIKLVNEKLDINPELKELSISLFNKKTHHDRPLPFLPD